MNVKEGTVQDLEKFQKLGKIPWEDRLALIHKEFPNSSQLDWARAFGDIDLLGRVLRDILKTDQSKPGRSGPRPALDRKQAESRLRQFLGADYTLLEFRDAFRVLADGRSHRHLATKIGLDRNLVQKLLAGKKDPDLPTIESIAQAFGKDPSYFLEYRVNYILGALGKQMYNAPEITVDLYKRISSGKSWR